MRAKPHGRFTVKEVERTEHDVTYRTFLLRGWLDGVRVRKQFQSRAEALGEKNRLEVRAANTGDVSPRLTRLNVVQLAEAEAAFNALGGQSLSFAVQWFKDNYRAPLAEKPIDEAATAFLAERALLVRPIVLDNTTLLSNTHWFGFALATCIGARSGGRSMRRNSAAFWSR